MADAQRDMASVQETVTRLDLGIYRLHANIKATQEMTRKVQTEVSEMAGVSANVQILRREVDNLLFQLPAGTLLYKFSFGTFLQNVFALQFISIFVVIYSLVTSSLGLFKQFTILNCVIELFWNFLFGSYFACTLS